MIRKMMLGAPAMILAVTLISATGAQAAEPATCSANTVFGIVAHGGAMSKRVKEPGRLAIMKAALTKARASLKAGASALDTVEILVRTFEDSGKFNTGKGAIANAAGMVETDASIMDGRDLSAGAVASMTAIKNPVHAARLVMEKTRHVLLAGDRGQAAVEKLGAQSVPPSYFINNKIKDTSGAEHGTVGAVALDRCGHIAAATSTGGFDAKIPGRVGDSPLVGDGVFADDNIAGFSATGHGEFFIRYNITKDVADRMAYLHESIDDAMDHDIHHKLADLKAEGALIGIDKAGNIAMQWNSAGLYRGYATNSEAPIVAVYEGPTKNKRAQ